MAAKDHSFRIASTHLYTWVERGTVIVCLSQEHSKMSPAKFEPRPLDPDTRRTNHEATLLCMPFSYDECMIEISTSE